MLSVAMFHCLALDFTMVRGLGTIRREVDSSVMEWVWTATLKQAPSFNPGMALTSSGERSTSSL